MDALGDLLEPHSELLGKIAGTITTFQFLSVFFLLNDIRKKQSSDVYPVGPYIGGTVLMAISIKLGQVMNDQPMINVNIIGLVVNTLFMFGFYYYASTERRTKIWIYSGYTALFLAVILAYAHIEDPQKLEFRLGIFVTAMLIWMVGSPLLNLPDVIKKKSTEGMPFPIILSGQIIGTAWTLYAISIRNEIMVNLVLWVLGGIQLFMFVLYPSTPAKKPSGKKASKKDN